MEDIDPEFIPLDIGGYVGAGWFLGKALALTQVVAIAYAAYKGYPQAALLAAVANGFSFLRENARYRRTGKHYDTEGLNR